MSLTSRTISPTVYVVSLWETTNPPTNLGPVDVNGLQHALANTPSHPLVLGLYPMNPRQTAETAEAWKAVAGVELPVMPSGAQMRAAWDAARERQQLLDDGATEDDLPQNGPWALGWAADTFPCWAWTAQATPGDPIGDPEAEGLLLLADALAGQVLAWQRVVFVKRLPHDLLLAEQGHAVRTAEAVGRDAGQPRDAIRALAWDARREATKALLRAALPSRVVQDLVWDGSRQVLVVGAQGAAADAVQKAVATAFVRSTGHDDQDKVDAVVRPATAALYWRARHLDQLDTESGGPLVVSELRAVLARAGELVLAVTDRRVPTEPEHFLFGWRLTPGGRLRAQSEDARHTVEVRDTADTLPRLDLDQVPGEIVSLEVVATNDLTGDHFRLRLGSAGELVSVRVPKSYGDGDVAESVGGGADDDGEEDAEAPSPAELRRTEAIRRRAVKGAALAVRVAAVQEAMILMTALYRWIDETQLLPMRRIMPTLTPRPLARGDRWPWELPGGLFWTCAAAPEGTPERVVIEALDLLVAGQLGRQDGRGDSRQGGLFGGQS